MELNQPPLFIREDTWKRAHYFTSMRKVVEYLEMHFGESIELETMARVACMEKTAFSRAFKRKIGSTPHKFTEAYRISRAAEMMKASDYSVTEIAFASGFGSLTTFERAFKKVVSIQPSTYRLDILQRSNLIPQHPAGVSVKAQQTFA